MHILFKLIDILLYKLMRVLSIKQSRANSILSKIRKYVTPMQLTPTYPTPLLLGLRILALFNIYRIVILQSKAIRRVKFQPSNFHASSLFKRRSISKFQDKTCLENILFVSKSLNNLSLSVLNTCLVFLQIDINMKPQVLHRVTS